MTVDGFQTDRGSVSRERRRSQHWHTLLAGDAGGTSLLGCMREDRKGHLTPALSKRHLQALEEANTGRWINKAGCVFFHLSLLVCSSLFTESAQICFTNIMYIFCVISIRVMLGGIQLHRQKIYLLPKHNFSQILALFQFIFIFLFFLIP